ncbi:MAG: hypothetical protein ACTSYD_08720, partial [Candidatus Heimdallarchaeaceae archaeon]
MSKEEIKSLTNSVKMLKNMIESMISAVQDRFKDYDKTIANLKHKIELLEKQKTKTDVSPSISQKFEQEIGLKIAQLEKRLDVINEKILMLEKTPTPAPTPAPPVKEAPPTPAPMPAPPVKEAPPTPAPMPAPPVKEA